MVGILPHRATIVRFVGALVADQGDEWQVAGLYMSPNARATARDDDNGTPQPDDKEDQPALPDAA